MNAIDAQHAELTYSDGTRAVRDVNLQVPRGEFFGFLGPNGAGKTTTIKMLVTLLKPSGGQITVNGYDVGNKPREVRESVGYMAQETSVDRELTARENIKFACEAYGVPATERAERIDYLLDLVDLADVADKEAGEFSGGMKKRLDAATALVHEPPIVFLDEPTTGLDPKARIRLWEYFRKINDQGTTMFLTTQYLEEADELCDRISVIQSGELVATDSPQSLKSKIGGDVLEISLEDPTEDDIEKAAQIAKGSGLFDQESVQKSNEGIRVTTQKADEAGIDLLIELRQRDLSITGFDVHSPTLDDVFLALTGEPTDDEPSVTSPSVSTGAGEL